MGVSLTILWKNIFLYVGGVFQACTPQPFYHTWLLSWWHVILKPHHLYQLVGNGSEFAIHIQQIYLLTVFHIVTNSSQKCYTRHAIYVVFIEWLNIDKFPFLLLVYILLDYTGT